MTFKFACLVLGAAVTLGACAPGTYPMSGRTVGTDDPVRSFQARDCVPFDGR
ncbi:hypothetical protein [Tranquillimonas alkanivorans]|uniref:Lipoprotein n=1 Tax=Tranquillimonas alkanivorans TaxID=441119 RepID=A0A1I5SZT5_9RHOB|nr:hypothetical protein [Tranquillimonas alkanivorans]SFP75947.1 hypothetical protein SAMN04488047_11263 [Tranquillimonas alkanivorans]